MTPLETLKAARQLISDPAKWTQGTMARNKDGNPWSDYGGEMCSFCAMGAVVHFEPVHIGKAWKHFFQVCQRKFKCGPAAFNDTHTHAEVLALFDAAIAELEGV